MAAPRRSRLRLTLLVPSRRSVETGHDDEGLPGGREGSCVPRFEGWLQGLLGGVGSVLRCETAGSGDAGGLRTTRDPGSVRPRAPRSPGARRAPVGPPPQGPPRPRPRLVRRRARRRAGQRRYLAAQRFGALSKGQRALWVTGEPARAGEQRRAAQQRVTRAGALGHAEPALEMLGGLFGARRRNRMSPAVASTQPMKMTKPPRSSSARERSHALSACSGAPRASCTVASESSRSPVAPQASIRSASVRASLSRASA